VPSQKKIYQVSRGGLFDLPVALLPENAIRIGEIASFNISKPPISNQNVSLLDRHAIPGTITLVNGEILDKIDRVLICTGYHCSFPFLREYHHDSVPVEKADDTTLVTDGTQMHNLHKDIFYIPDPTLAFVGVPYHVATFTLFEFQAIAIAAVYSGKADLPIEEAMRTEYQLRVAEKGHGKAFHSLQGKDVEYANSLVDWINKDAELRGGKAVEGHSREWHAAFENFRMQIRNKSERILPKMNGGS